MLPKGQFRYQRQRAKRRGISFLLTFDQWLQIWNASAHFAERGKGHGKYCMSRRGDRHAEPTKLAMSLFNSSTPT